VCGDTGEVRQGKIPLRAPSEKDDEDLRTLTRWAREISPLTAWRPDEVPPRTEVATGVDVSSDTVVHDAVRDHVRAVVTEHPLPVMLAAIHGRR
jgi:pyruvate,orthophosphate dikinase